MDKKFLNKVVDQIVSETNIDYEEEELYVPFTTSSFHSYFPSLFRSYGAFNFHCQDVYGLSSLEIKYVWDKWEVIILDKIRSKGSINESTGMNKEFLNKVVKQIIGETKIDYDKEEVYFPFDPDLFTFYYIMTGVIVEDLVIDKFFHHCKNVYGLHSWDEMDYVWEDFIKIIKNKVNVYY